MSSIPALRDDSSPEKIMEYLVKCFSQGRAARLAPEPLATLVGYVEALQATADAVPAVRCALQALLELGEAADLIDVLQAVDECASQATKDRRAKLDRNRARNAATRAQAETGRVA
jgi:hypothetical protein